jgi:hypothetical protein
MTIPLLLALAPALPAHDPATPARSIAYWDSVDAQGRLFGGRFEVDAPPPRSTSGVLPAAVDTLTHSLLPPPTGNRIDLVFVGDGYQQSQLASYATHVSNIVASFFAIEPYASYQPYFTVHRVDVVSVDSGVDNDPTQGISRNTAMDMGYWCAGIQRALCVDVGKAYQFANNAPDWDLICAIANSTTYGGVGYPQEGLATAAGANVAAVQIVQHEFGHTLGKLADEYDYGGPANWGGGEPFERDVSTLTAAQMQSAGTKWAQWLGTNDAAFDGLVSTFEGAYYSQFGIYRPTSNSLMRNLGRPFNLPSAESVVIEIYKIVRPIDASSSTTASYAGTETLSITPQTPAAPFGGPLTIQWKRNGQPIPGATGTTLDLSTLVFAGCPATISVTLTDETPLVRNAAARAQWLTQTLVFQVAAAQPVISNYCVAATNSTGNPAYMTALGSTSIGANDLVLECYGTRPNALGIFFYGQVQTQVPFGNGWRCVDNPLFRLPAHASDAAGNNFLPLDHHTLPQAGQISAGQAWNFQCYYRDAAGGGAFFNASDGLHVIFCP